MADFAGRPLLALVALIAVLTGCRTTVPRSALPADPPVRTLTLIVAELGMHLRDDSYRCETARTEDGRNLFRATLWRLQRVQQERNRTPANWENVDIVIEFARARALERLRRYSEAADAYDRVAATGSTVADAAGEASVVMRQFEQYALPLEDLFSHPEQELRALNERVDVWRELAWKYRDTTYQSLALEDTEDWESKRVDRIERIRGPEDAIVFARALIEHNSGSKLHARHLIRLGDLFAAVARREQSRANSGLFDAVRYESFLDQALASYELAEDERKPGLRSLAASKILALIVFHQENLRRAP